MNKRLAGDETEDPDFPKIQFPEKSKCPQCYKDSVASNDSSFDVNEVMKYLLSFYSIHGIEGEDELNKATEEYFANKQKKIEETKTIGHQIEANEVDDTYRVHMADLEAGLNYMLRDEITRLDVIEGDNLKLLKDWMSVLAKVKLIHKKKKILFFYFVFL